MSEFKCDDNCGRCCRELTLEIMEIDLMREPLLRQYARKIDIGDEDKSNPFEQAYYLPSPCPMINNDSKCTIYPTRPNLCVAYSDQCLNNK